MIAADEDPQQCCDDIFCSDVFPLIHLFPPGCINLMTDYCHEF
uniref:Uncharacterized protein n=1 Tax=Klebsiella pneumoniae TaxID=573 RepID=A0A6M4NYF4_KLEPN|nr:hypothetical protein [Klebsiella pneumoniae]QIS32125.1 hypothetical protein [Klebsiella pneumoniae]QJS02716.1 hypothetical protein [Klebsiella pneumoniae]QUW40568.1 hypothetical protein [Raoultella ornithinolytica]UNJ79800.1 hypothetical protein [Raoultella ornithinolytica]